MLMGRGIGRGISFKPNGTAPRAVFAGKDAGADAIWTMELNGTSLTARTSTFASTDRPEVVTWDGTYFFIAGIISGSTAAKIQRSTDGISWTLVANVTVTTGHKPHTILTDGKTHYCILFNAAIDSNWSYLKSTDGGATWSASEQTKSVSGATDMGCHGACFDPVSKEFFILNNATAGVHVRYDMALNEIDRFPAAGTTGNWLVRPRYWKDQDLLLGKNGVSVAETDLYGMSGDLSADRAIVDNNTFHTGLTNYANTTNYDGKDWYVYNNAGTLYLEYSTDGSTWANDHSWTPVNAIQLAILSSMTVQGDYIIMFYIKTATDATAPEVRLSWDGGTTFNTYNVPGTFGTKGDGIIDGVV